MTDLKETFSETIRRYHQKGWSPATSTNYSYREGTTIWVSRSGVDKSEFSLDDFITVDKNGCATGAFSALKPSAETLIHCALYELFPSTQVILHSHSVFPVLISTLYENGVIFNGYELQKGFSGQSTHDASVSIPIFDNTQDMKAFSQTLKNAAPILYNHCFILRKHGTYAWGESLFEAKRHLETLEYLCELDYRKKVMSSSLL